MTSSAFPGWHPFDPASPSSLPSLAEEREAGTVVVLAVAVDAGATAWARRAAAAITREWAERSERIFLMDLDLASPGLHETLEIENEEGAADLFLFGSSLQRVAREIDEGAFFFASAGTPTADPRAVLTHERWDRLIAGFRDAEAALLLYLPLDLPGADRVLARADRVVILGEPGSLDDGAGTYDDVPVVAAFCPPESASHREAPDAGAAVADAQESRPLEPPVAEASSEEVAPADMDEVGETDEVASAPVLDRVVDIADLAPDPPPAPAPPDAEVEIAAPKDAPREEERSVGEVVDIRDLAPDTVIADTVSEPVDVPAPADGETEVPDESRPLDAEPSIVDDAAPFRDGDVVDIEALAPDVPESDEDEAEAFDPFAGSGDAVEEDRWGVEGEDGVEVEAEGDADAGEAEDDPELGVGPPAVSEDRAEGGQDGPPTREEDDHDPFAHLDEVIAEGRDEDEEDDEDVGALPGAGEQAGGEDEPEAPGWGEILSEDLPPGPEPTGEADLHDVAGPPAHDELDEDARVDELEEVSLGEDPPIEGGEDDERVELAGDGDSAEDEGEGALPSPEDGGSAQSDFGEDLVTGPDFGDPGAGMDEGDETGSVDTSAWDLDEESSAPPAPDPYGEADPVRGPADATVSESPGSEKVAAAAETGAPRSAADGGDDAAAAPPVARPRTEDRREGRPVRLFVLLLLVAGGAFTAHWFGLVRVPGLDRGLASVLGPARTGAAPTVETPAPVPETGVLGFSLLIDRYRDFRSGEDVAEALGERVPSGLFLVTPVQEGRDVSYRLLAGPAATEDEARALRSSLAGVLTREDPERWEVLATPLAFLVGESTTRSAAESRAADLRAGDIPAYVLQVSYSQEDVRYRVYAGAFESRDEARALRGLVAQEGHTGWTLTERRGRIPE